MDDGHATILEFLDNLMRYACDATGIGVVVVKGNKFTTHSFNLDTEDLEITARLFREYASEGQWRMQ